MFYLQFQGYEKKNIADRALQTEDVVVEIMTVTADTGGIQALIELTQNGGNQHINYLVDICLLISFIKNMCSK